MPALEARLDVTGDAERGNCDRSIHDRSATPSHPRPPTSLRPTGSRRSSDDPPGRVRASDARQRMLSPVGRGPVPFVE